MLGNRKNRDWSKSDHFAPVLWFDSLSFLVSRALKQGDYKYAFCPGILLAEAEEKTFIRPPSGDPDASEDEYWLLL